MGVGIKIGLTSEICPIGSEICEQLIYDFEVVAVRINFESNRTVTSCPHWTAPRFGNSHPLRYLIFCVTDVSGAYSGKARGQYYLRF